MKSFGKYALRFVLRTCARIGWHGPFIWILSRTIVEHPVSKAKGGKRRPTLLALSPEGFRGDLDVLSESGNFRVLLAPTRWQTRLMYLFYPERLRSRDYLNPEPCSPYIACKKRLQAFYRELLPGLYARLGIDAVISYHVRLPADVDWGMASDQAGYPYVVLYREGLFASYPNARKTMAILFQRFGFWGTHLVVHNESCRELCIETGLAQPEKVSALGCLRMDGFLHRVQRAARQGHSRRRVVLFPISLKENGKYDMSLMPFFHGVHGGLIKLAKKYPDVEFVMKPKPKVYREWRRLLDRTFEREGSSPAQLPNLVMDPHRDAQDLILEADVVCGIDTTTVLEAAIAGKSVVIPYFHELRQMPYRNSIKFADAFAYLDVADDEEHFVQMIEERLVNPDVSLTDMEGRRKVFEKYVSDPDGHAVEKYTELLSGLIERFTRQRMSGSLNTRRAAASLQAEDIIP